METNTVGKIDLVNFKKYNFDIIFEKTNNKF